MNVWGGAAFSVSVPMDPALIHAQVAVQAVVIPPATGIPIASNALILRVAP